MDTLLVVARALHFGASLLLLGELVFAVLIARPPAADPSRDRLDSVTRRLVVFGAWSLAVSVLAGALWLTAEAVEMSGLPPGQALSRATLRLVVFGTGFGRLWILRACVAIAIGVLLCTVHRGASYRRRCLRIRATLVGAAIYVATLAWAGHAGSGQGAQHWLQLGADVVHLLGAAAWIGALPALIATLRSAPSQDAALTTQRFSIVGMTSVGALAMSGLVNAWYLVGGVPALVGTDYGRTLCVKLAVFGSMIVLALVNRLHLTPRLASADHRARRTLRRNAIAETILGVCALLLVAALGIMVPGAHQAPVWPFAHTLNWPPEADSGSTFALVVAAGMILGGAVAAFMGARRLGRRSWVAGSAGIVGGVAIGVWQLAVPAYPTSYATSPVPYTTVAIARGATLYAGNCTACHGADGRGDGPAAASLPIRPVDLVEHAAHHRVGDLFWWIAHGIPGTPMPGLEPRLDAEATWDLVQFLRAQSYAQEAITMTGRVEPWRPIAAPEFDYELATGELRSFPPRREALVALLVFYSLPESLPRLRTLVQERQSRAYGGVRIVALPTRDVASVADLGRGDLAKSVLGTTAHDVAGAYARFARTRENGDPGAPGHFEFLIDRQGYLRARTIGVPDSASAWARGLPAQIEFLEHEAPHAAPAGGHAH